MANDDVSPLLSGAIEDLSHALEHAQTGSEKDNKYAVIHAATAVELVLKEKLRSMGISIFEKRPPYHSLDFYDCIHFLHDNSIPIPLEADIEFLHRERNSCIHLAGKPDKNKARWLLDIAKQFMGKFCSTQLGFDINRYLPIEVETRVLDEARRAHLNPAGIYLANAEMAMIDDNYAEAVLNAEAAIELLMKDYLETRNIKVSPIFHELTIQIEKEGKLPRFILDTVEDLHNIRNSIAHLTTSADKNTAQKAINLARIVFDNLGEFWKRERRCVVCGSADVVGVEQSFALNISQIKNRNGLDKAIERAIREKRAQLLGFYCKKHQPYWATK